MQKKIHVLIIHGGTTFKNEKGYLHYLKTKRISTEKKIGWTGEYLENGLGNRFKVVAPRMPLQDNAKYRDWKILFERYLDLLSEDFILIGNSLGGMFIAKYLSENELPRKTLSTFLVCPPFDDTLPGETLSGGFKLKNDLSLLEKNSRRLHLLFSRDDDVVPVAHAEKYRSKLPRARINIYKNKNGHFLISKFPEIIKKIKADVAQAA